MSSVALSIAWASAVAIGHPRPPGRRCRRRPLFPSGSKADADVRRHRDAAAWKGVGRFTGPLEPLGFAATNGAIEMIGVDIHEFDVELVKRVQT